MYVWTGLVSCSADLYPEEVYEDIKEAYEDNLLELSFTGLKEIERMLSLGKERVLDGLRRNGRYRLILDAISQMEYWACFQTWAKERRALGKKPRRIGRNEPCPCGSGKKDKKCCAR